MSDIELDPEDFDTLGENATADIEKALNSALGDTQNQPDWDLDPDNVVTKDELEDQIGDIGGISEEDAAEVAQQYSLGGLHHIIEGDCDHPEHQKIREKLGLGESQDEDSGGSDDDSSEGAEEDGPEGDSSSDSEESDSGQSDGDSGNGGAWGRNG